MNTKILPIFFACLSVAAGQVVIPVNGVYSESFYDVGSGLPAGWSVWTGAITTSLGQSASFSSTPADWSATLGAFKNLASSDGLDALASTGEQNLSSNRVTGHLVPASGSGTVSPDPSNARLAKSEDGLGAANDGNFAYNVTAAEPKPRLVHSCRPCQPRPARKAEETTLSASDGLQRIASLHGHQVFSQIEPPLPLCL